MQVPNGTGPGVRRSKRPLLASRTRCNVLWKTPKFGNKVNIGIKVQFGNKFANRCNVWSIEGVIVYGHVPECHVTFGGGRLHNVWWDPHIDHKTSWGTISNVPWHIPVWVNYVKLLRLRLLIYIIAPRTSFFQWDCLKCITWLPPLRA